MGTVILIPVKILDSFQTPQSRLVRPLPHPRMGARHDLVLCGEGVSFGDARAVINAHFGSTANFGFTILGPERRRSFKRVRDTIADRVLEIAHQVSIPLYSVDPSYWPGVDTVDFITTTDDRTFFVFYEHEIGSVEFV